MQLTQNKILYLTGLVVGIVVVGGLLMNQFLLARHMKTLENQVIYTLTQVQKVTDGNYPTATKAAETKTATPSVKPVSVR